MVCKNCHSLASNSSTLAMSSEAMVEWEPLWEPVALAKVVEGSSMALFATPALVVLMDASHLLQVQHLEAGKVCHLILFVCVGQSTKYHVLPS